MKGNIYRLFISLFIVCATIFFLDVWISVGMADEKGGNFVDHYLPSLLPDSAPVAGDNSYMIFEEGMIELSLPGILDNDNDPEGDPITAISLLSGPVTGTFVFTGDGTFAYTPPINYYGVVTFTYQITSDAPDLPTADFGPTPFDTFGTGESYAVALGDMDGDGDLDVVVANDWFGAEQVWLNDGNGNFPAAANHSFGAGDSFDVALGDIDGDGDLDAVVANYWDQAQTVWLNDGTGNLGTIPADSFGVSRTHGIALGDLDGDGDLDAILANDWLGKEQVWLNQGGVQGGTEGDFASTAHQSFGSLDTIDVVLGDVDEDGDLDALFANGWGQAQQLWVNDGAANFSLGNSFGGGNSRAIDLGDLDGDGDLDFVVANDDGGAQEVWLNQGGIQLGTVGTFIFTNSFGGGNSRAIDLGDLDGDGDLDIIIGTYGQLQEIWLNNGAALFSSFDSFGGGNSRSVALGDLDGDGDLDVALANYSNEAEEVWLNPNVIAPPLGSNIATVTITVTAVNDAPVATDGTYVINEDSSMVGNVLSDDTGFGIDFDLDGDLLTAVLSEPPISGTLLFTPDGSFSYTPAVDYNGVVTFTYFAYDGFVSSLGIDYGSIPFDSFGGQSSWYVKLADLDGDGDLDVVVANYDNQPQEVWMNQGGIQSGLLGDYGSAPFDSFGGSYAESIDLGDVDGDGDLDLLIANGSNQPQEIWINQGGAQAGIAGDYEGPSTTFGGGNSSAARLRDMDGDGDLDAIIGNRFGQGQEIWKNDGTGDFGTIPYDVFDGWDSFDLEVGDLDGDGDLDVLLSNVSGGAEVVWLNDGTGNMGATEYHSFGGSESLFSALGDLDGDGDLDILVGNGSNQPEQVWLNDGTGNFGSTPYDSFEAGNTTFVILNDIDLDGDLDAIMANYNNQPQEVWLNDGTADFGTQAVAIFGGGSSNSIDVGDLNLDGYPDIMLANNLGEDQEVWLRSTSPTMITVITITVTAVNDAPIAVDDWYTATESVTLTVPITGVLNNDVDVDTALLTATLLVDVLTGTLNLNNDGSFSYYAPNDYTGIVTFSYSCGDGAYSSNGTVSITVVHCPGAVIPVSPIAVTPSATDLTFDWSTTADASAYEVWSSNLPYFEPGNDCNNPAPGLSCVLIAGTNWVDTGVYGDPALNHYYKIFGANTTCGIEASSATEHVAEFDYEINYFYGN